MGIASIVGRQRSLGVNYSVESVERVNGRLDPKQAIAGNFSAAAGEQGPAGRRCRGCQELAD